MSLKATLWAYDDAPIEKPTELLVLIALADDANNDGRNAFPSVARIAKRARCKPRAAKYALRALEASGVIVKGDQSIAARHITRADRRPVVYDLVLTMTWDSAPPPTERGADDAPGERGAREGPDGVHQDVTRGASEGTSGVHGGAPDPRDDPTDNPTTDPTPGGKPPVRDLNNGRDDVERTCSHLSQRLTERQVRHAITKAWRDAARLLIDSDSRTEQQIHNMIEWVDTSEFWRPNVHSMTTLRERYDQMREQAMRGTGPTNLSNRHIDPGSNLGDDAAWEAPRPQQEATP